MTEAVKSGVEIVICNSVRLKGRLDKTLHETINCLSLSFCAHPRGSTHSIKCLQKRLLANLIFICMFNSNMECSSRAFLRYKHTFN